MFDALNINTDFQDKYRHLTKYKKLIVLAKIDGTNWYDISDYALEFRVLNRIEVVNSPAVDAAVLKVKNVNNCFTPTQYNDVFDPSQGKFNGTIEDDYLNKVWEVKAYIEVHACDFYRYGIALPENSTAYWRCSLVDVVNGIIPEGYTEGEDNKILIPVFWGWKPAEAIKEKHKTAQIELKDLLWIATQKKPDNPLLYAGYTPDEILNDIFTNRLGFDSSYLDLQELTTIWEVYIADNNKTWWNIIQEIVNATGGKITCSPDGKIKFRTRIENYSDPSTVLTINEENIKNYNLDKKRQYNKIKVQSEGYEIGTTQEFVVDHELEGDARTIQAGQQATFEFEYTSEYIKNPDNGVYISYAYGSSPIATDEYFTEGQDDGNIRVDEIIVYPDKLVLKITNLASSTDYALTHVKFKAVPIRKKEEINVEKPNQTNEPDSEYSITSFYSDENLLSNIADVVYNETTKAIRFDLQLNEFYPDLYAGNLVNLELTPKGIASGIFLVEQVEHSIEASKFTTRIKVVEWGSITFNIGDKTITKPIISDYIQKSDTEHRIEILENNVSDIQEQVDTIDDLTSYLDGVEPSTPSGLSLSTINENGVSFITASWAANTETDLLGYELAWSYDNTNWNYITTADTLVKFPVAGNITVYVKVRAYDAESKKSNWSSTENITSAKDEVPPDIPTGLTATGLFQTIMVKWNANSEEDFSHYVLEYDTVDTFDNEPQQITLNATSTVIKDLSVNTTYYFRIKAVDTSGNESDWNADNPPVSASTAKIDDENYLDYLAIKDCIIHNGKIDTAWISELNAGVITAGILQGTSGTTKFDLDNDLISIDNGNVKIGKDAISSGVHGILVQNGNIKLQGANSITTIDLTEDKITVGSNVIIGKDALGTGRNGILVNNGDIQITGGVLTGANGTTEIDLDNDKITVGTDLVKIGKEVATKFVDKIEILVDVTSSTGFSDAHIYASLDNSNWIDLGSTSDLDGNKTQVNLFNYVAYGQTIYLKVEEMEAGEAEDGDIDVYVDDALFDTYHYEVDADTNPSQVFTITLPDEKNDGIEINSGVLNVPNIVMNTDGGKIIFKDSYWELKDKQQFFGDSQYLANVFENVYFGDSISLYTSNEDYDLIPNGVGIELTPANRATARIIADRDSALLHIGFIDPIEEDIDVRVIVDAVDEVVKTVGYGLVVPLVSTTPPAIRGLIYFNTSDNKFYGYNGSSWVVLG